jgi:hypothetical protein
MFVRLIEDHRRVDRDITLGVPPGILWRIRHRTPPRILPGGIVPIELRDFHLAGYF